MNAPLRRLSLVVAALFLLLFGSTSWVQAISAQSLNEQPGNVRSLYKELGRHRGPLLIAGTQIAESVPVDDAYRYQRRYPRPTGYGHITGFYSVIFGSTGMEQAVDDLLAGTADQLFYRRISDLLTGVQPRGASVELTIDPQAQLAAWQALGNQRGAVVALDPRTGAVLALVSKPSFDPNELADHNRKRATAARQRLLDDPDRPLENRAISGRLYPPGSVFKLITSAAALESGDYEPDTQLNAPDVLDLPQTTAQLRNWGGSSCSGNGKLSLADSLRISCNTSFGWLGLQLGQDALREQAEKFGFGQDLSIPLRATPSQFPADVNAPQTAQTAIGQFDLRVTPLQIAMVSAGIANDGVVMRPNLVKEVRAQDLELVDEFEPEEFSEAIDEDTARALTEMMVGVVERGTGTRAQIDGVQVAGKSGTAEHGEGRDPHAWFTAFAPADDPQVAVAVVVEDGGEAGSEASGGRVAAPIAKAVLEAVVR